MVVSALVRNFGGKFSSLAAIVLKKYAKIMAFLLLIVSIGIISFSIHGITFVK
jgi:predicted subunit of tRNA(5-methylaminomethyl-2-thiouridylate) methyltransferase